MNPAHRRVLRASRPFWVAIVLLAGCDASPSGAPASSGPRGADAPPLDPSAHPPALPAVPESLKPFVAELEELHKHEQPSPTGILIKGFGLPRRLPYQMADGGKLVGIDLSYTPITDEFLKKLEDFPDLETLILSGTNITDAGLESLVDVKSLKWLTIWATLISDEAVANFLESHPTCTVNGPGQNTVRGPGPSK